jgi:chemotaxis protein MotA
MAETIKRTSKPGKRAGGKPDFATVIGVVVSAVAILGGLLMEGGKIGDVAQITAAMIVLGGTAGAVMVSTPLHVLTGAMKRLGSVFLDSTPDLDGIAEELVGYVTQARKNGLVSLEQEVGSISDPFLRKALNLAVDGTDLQEIRKMLELEIDIEDQAREAEAKVFESAGGYAPTIGIIGAVLGLIQVMKNLANIDEVGHGIAVSFVATVYGVGLANLVLLPAAQKIKARQSALSQRQELILEGVSGMVEGLNPKLIREKLQAFRIGHGSKSAKESGALSAKPEAGGKPVSPPSRARGESAQAEG